MKRWPDEGRPAMKLLLVNPSQINVYGKSAVSSQPHMGLAYIASVLEEAGHHVSVIDADFDKVNPRRTGEIVSSRGIDAVGLTATTPVVESAIEIARAVKQARPQAVVIIGGVHATVMPSTFEAEDAFDYIVQGEAEKTILELLRAIESGEEPTGVPGLSFKKDGRRIRTGKRRPVEDLDSIPFPARHLFSSKQYRYPGTMYAPAFGIQTSRGCPARCSFCQTMEMCGQKVRFRSAASVVDEMETLIKKFKAREIHVWDDNFAASKERVFQIRDEIGRRGLKPLISFTSGIRVDTACDGRVLEAMREMGGYSIAFGVESGDQDILDRIQKGITLDQVRRAVSLAKKLGFEVWIFMMLGFPDDDERTMKRTIEFAKELDPHIVKFHILKPYPGSRVHEEMKRDGLIGDFNYRHYGLHTFPVHRTKHVPAAKIREYQKAAYRTFYLRPSVWMRQLPRMRSFCRIKSNLLTLITLMRLIGARSE